MNNGPENDFFMKLIHFPLHNNFKFIFNSFIYLITDMTLKSVITSHEDTDIMNVIPTFRFFMY